MEDRVSREAKLMVAKEIVTTFIKASVVKEGESQHPSLSIDEVCHLFKRVFETVEETIPSPTRKVGLG